MANIEKLREATLYDYEMERKYLMSLLKSGEATAEQKEYAMKRVRKDDYWIRKLKQDIADSNPAKTGE